MKLNLRVLVLASVIFAAAFTTNSSATEAKAEDDERQLSSILPLLAGPLLGLFLGSILGGSFGRMRRGGRRCGRDLDGNNNPFDKIERDLMRDQMEVMVETAEEQCYERMICDIAARDEHIDCEHFKDFMSLVTDGDEYVPMEYADFHGQLKEAYYKGEGSGDSAFCESTYECPLTGEEMADMMKSQYEGDDE